MLCKSGVTVFEATRDGAQYLKWSIGNIFENLVANSECFRYV